METTQQKRNYFFNFWRSMLTILLSVATVLFLVFYNWVLAILLAVPAIYLSHYISGFILWPISIMLFPLEQPTKPRKSMEESDKEIAQDSYEIAREKLAEEEYESALYWFDLSILLDDANAEALIDRAYCSQRCGYHIDAISDLDDAIAKSPDDCNLLFLRSISKTEILDLEGALDDVKEAIRLADLKLPGNRAYEEQALAWGYSCVSNYYHMQMLHSESRIEDAQMKRHLELSSKSKRIRDQLKKSRESKELEVSKMTRNQPNKI